MTELESSLHLYQRPLYQGSQGDWRTSFIDAVSDCPEKLTWDVSAILSIISFGYPCGNRTLVNEVRRQPWLSSIRQDNEVFLEKLPQHGRLWVGPSEIAKNLEKLLCDEAYEVCKDRKEIYLLLSGGLDSRIVAGVLAKLCKEGRIDVTPIGVTWGLEDSRDVYYGRMTAETLGFKWEHIGLGPEDLAYNTEELSLHTGGLVSPVHLHRMHWFKNVSKDALVLAGSYGDSVGRAEFNGLHILELNYLYPKDIFGLLRKEVYQSAYDGIISDLKALHELNPGQPQYVYCEYEMQGYYMRNMTGQVMSVINNYCSIYQMFTNPKTYSYVWSIHPALRDNRIYGALLEKLNSRLARMPWARTNRALQGKTTGALSGLRQKFHRYKYWTGEILFERLKKNVDPEWFDATGIFNGAQITKLTEEVYRTRDGESVFGSLPHEKWLWLASFRCLAEKMAQKGKTIRLDDDCVHISENCPVILPEASQSFVRQIASRSVLLYKISKYCKRILSTTTKRFRRHKINQIAIRKYPPQKEMSK